MNRPPRRPKSRTSDDTSDDGTRAAVRRLERRTQNAEDRLAQMSVRPEGLAEQLGCLACFLSFPFGWICVALLRRKAYRIAAWLNLALMAAAVSCTIGALATKGDNRDPAKNAAPKSTPDARVAGVPEPAPLGMPDVRRKVDTLTLRDGTELRGDAKDLTSEGVTFYDLERLEWRRFTRAEVHSLKVKGRIVWTPGTAPAPVKPPPPVEEPVADAPEDVSPQAPPDDLEVPPAPAPPKPPEPSGPDKLVLADGTTLQGRCIASVEGSVMFEWGTPPQRRTFKAAEVAKLYKAGKLVIPDPDDDGCR